MLATEMPRAQRGEQKPANGKRFGEPRGGGNNPDRPEPEILFQKYFKASGSRTYAAQVKRASNGNHFLVVTDARRDPKTDELRKSMVFVFSEDFPEFFRLLQETAQFIKANPVPEEVQRRREQWKRSQPGRERSAPKDAE